MREWEDRLDEWELELELGMRMDGSDWVTLERAAADTGVSRAALRNWYRTGQIPSRLVDGPHGPPRGVPHDVIVARAEASPRLRRSAERRLAWCACPVRLPRTGGRRRHPGQARCSPCR